MCSKINACQNVLFMVVSSLSFTDADEQQHPDHRSHGDGGWRQAANQAAVDGLRPHWGRSQGGPGSGIGCCHRTGRSRERGRATHDTQHHREALPLVHQRQDPGAARPRHGQRRQGVCAAAVHAGSSRGLMRV